MPRKPSPQPGAGDEREAARGGANPDADSGRELTGLVFASGCAGVAALLAIAIGLGGVVPRFALLAALAVVLLVGAAVLAIAGGAGERTNSTGAALTRERTACLLVLIASAALVGAWATFLGVLTGEPGGVHEAAPLDRGLAAWAMTGAVGGLGYLVVRPNQTVMSAAVSAWAVVFIVVCAALFAPATGVAATAVAASLVALATAPRLSLLSAGLSVPRLPTAGQDLAVSDSDIRAPSGRAEAAHRIHAGIIAGAALAGTAGALAIGCTVTAAAGRGTSPGFVTALCLCCGVAVVLHTLRQRDEVATWALWLWAHASVVGAALGVVRSTSTVAGTAGQLPGASAWVQLGIIGGHRPWLHRYRPVAPPGSGSWSRPRWRGWSASNPSRWRPQSPSRRTTSGSSG